MNINYDDEELDVFLNGEHAYDGDQEPMFTCWENVIQDGKKQVVIHVSHDCELIPVNDGEGKILYCIRRKEYKK